MKCWTDVCLTNLLTDLVEMPYSAIFPRAFVGKELTRTNLESNKAELNKNIVYQSLSLRIRFHPIY